jgi:hypothetical protein
MPLQSMFLSHIDSLDGEIEVRAEPGLDFTSCHFGPFSLSVDHADNRAVIALIGQVMAQPDRDYPSIALESGETLQAGAHIQRNPAGDPLQKLLYISSNAIHLRLHFGTASLLVGALSEAYAWQQLQQLAGAKREGASC